MFCPKCGNSFKGNERFCTKCGAPRPDGAAPTTASTPQPAPAPAPQPTPAPRPTPQPAPAPRPAPGKKRTGLIVAIVALVLALVAAVAVTAFLLINRGGDSDDSGSNKTHAVTDDARKSRKSKSENKDDAPTRTPAAEAPIPAAGYDLSRMEGTYYSTTVPGHCLYVSDLGDELYVQLTQDESVELSEFVSVPDGATFMVEGVRFTFSEPDVSFTLVSGGIAELFTPDGDDYWPSLDPFSDPDGYILPSDARYLTEADLLPYDAEQLKYIRNEIYARHGYTFTMDKFRDYFLTKNWYFEDPSVNANTFGTAQMNEYEVANLDLIRAREAELGG